MALPADFNKIYGSTATGGLTPISDVNYAKGWEFVGSNPPTKNDFSYLQNLSDLKSQWLYSNKLQRSDPFGDIKSDGPWAVSAALSNLGIGTAAKRDVGNSPNQIPDMSFFTLALSGAFRLPTGHIIQTGGGTTVSGGFTQAYPYPFPGSCQALVGIVYGTLGQRAFVTSNSSDRTAANLNVVDINGNGLNASVGYIAIGY